MKKELTPEQRKAIIAALAKGDLEAVKAIKEVTTGEKVIIHNFLEYLKFTNTEGRKFEDFEKVEIAPGEFRDALMKMNTDETGELKTTPPWWIPVDSLTDEEIELYKDSEGKTTL